MESYGERDFYQNLMFRPRRSRHDDRDAKIALASVSVEIAIANLYG
jgi:hypothetical protein